MSLRTRGRKEKIEPTAPANIRIETNEGTFETSTGEGKPAAQAIDTAMLTNSAPKSAVDKVGDTVDAVTVAIDAHEQWLKDEAKGRKLDLTGSTVTRKVLGQAKWRGRDLSEANFATADVGLIDFTDCDLSDADLSQCVNVKPGQFGGAVLERAKLPDKFDFPDVATTEEMSKNCGKYFLSILGACAYILLTVLSTKDASLITDSSSSTLPILQTSVSITSFFYTAPIVLLLVYVFYLINMQTLWKTMARLPAVFPNGRDIEEATYPWIVNSIACHYTKRLKKKRSWGGILTVVIATVLAYYSVPIALVFPWLRTIHRIRLGEPWQLYKSYAIIISLGIYMSVMCYRNAAETLRRSHFTGPQDVRESGWKWRKLDFAAWHCLTIVLTLITGWSIVNVSRSIQYGWHPARAAFLTRYLLCGPLDIDSTNVSTRPQNWKGSTQADYEAIAGADLRGLDLSRVNGQHAFLVHADFRGSDLSGADFQYADLRSSLLLTSKKPELRAAQFDLANLQHAQLDWAEMNGVNLINSLLVSATLTNANLAFADLTDASLVGADLSGADVQAAVFTNANLRHADFRHAKNLTSNQLSKAFGDDSTKLDPGLRPVNNPHWLHGSKFESIDNMWSKLTGRPLWYHAATLDKASALTPNQKRPAR